MTRTLNARVRETRKCLLIQNSKEHSRVPKRRNKLPNEPRNKHAKRRNELQQHNSNTMQGDNHTPRSGPD